MSGKIFKNNSNLGAPSFSKLVQNLPLEPPTARSTFVPRCSNRLGPPEPSDRHFGQVGLFLGRFWALRFQIWQILKRVRSASTYAKWIKEHNSPNESLAVVKIANDSQRMRSKADKILESQQQCSASEIRQQQQQKEREIWKVGKVGKFKKVGKVHFYWSSSRRLQSPAAAASDKEQAAAAAAQLSSRLQSAKNIWSLEIWLFAF